MTTLFPESSIERPDGFLGTIGARIGNTLLDLE